MSLNQTFRCDKCNVPHQMKIRNPSVSANFSFICRKCGSKISGSYTDGSWEINNASISEKEGDETVYLHEPELK